MYLVPSVGPILYVVGDNNYLRTAKEMKTFAM